MRVPAAPRPSPARGAQIAAAMRFPAAGAGHPGHRSGAHDAARSARDAPAEKQRLLGGRPQFICFAGAPLLCPRPIRLKDARTCAAVRRGRLLGAAAQKGCRWGPAPPTVWRRRGPAAESLEESMMTDAVRALAEGVGFEPTNCLLYTSPSPRD